MSTVHHLAPVLSSFVGRAVELTAIAESLEPGRLLTLVGPGGCGKSRLARATVTGEVVRWPDGAWWVDLGGEPSGDHVVRRLADTLDDLLPYGLRTLPASARELAERELLLVFDNCEHVLADVAVAISRILTQCPRVVVLATSQVPVGVAGERVWRVPPMTMGDALELFLERAKWQGADVGNAAARSGARRVCERLDRLPLALELAAGWASTLSPAQIADALARPLAFLHGGPSSAPFRQQSLEESMRWSHDRLGSEEKTLFRRLGAFRAGFTADAVADVCGFGNLSPDRILRSLRGLVDASLVVADTSGDLARYSMLEVIRVYAEARLDESGESPATLDRHLDVYLSVAEGLRPLLGTDKDTWRRLIEPEYANMGSAIDWGLSRDDTRPARRLAAEIAWLWHLHGRADAGLPILRRAVEAGGEERSAVQARALLAVAIVADPTAASMDGYAAACAAEEMALPFEDWPTILEARLLRAIGLIGEDLDAARSLASEVAANARSRGHLFAAEASEVLVGLICLMRDEYGDAIHSLDEATQGLLARGDRGVAATGLTFLALAYARSGRVDRASAVAGEAVTAAEPLHDVHRVGTALSTLADVRRLQGRLDAAGEELARVARLVDDAGPTAYVPGWERSVACVELCRGNPVDAVRWCRREGEVLGASADGFLTLDTQLVLAAALRAAGEETPASQLLKEVEKATRAFGLPGNVATALELRAEALDTGDDDRAVTLHHEALRIRAEHRLVLGCIDSLEALATLAWRRGAVEVAAILVGATERARMESGYAGRALAADRRGALAPLLTEPSTRSAAERGRQLDLWNAVEYTTRARGPRRRPDSGRDSLTPTEKSVVALVVQGLSNPEIANQLFMSRGTVKTHLAHTYAKLGIANRTQLAMSINSMTVHETGARPAQIAVSDEAGE